MKKPMTFSISPVATAVSLVLTAGLAFPVYAQDQGQDNEEKAKEESIEVINVSGIRGSLARSTDFKRQSSGVVDAISAEEMGKFPDTNLAESLQRITGVSVSRNDGEGSQITVRGFGPEFNLITLNNRQMPGTGFTRSYSLEALSSEGVTALEVYKTARADTPSGGLGATVNIVTTRPFQHSGQKFVVMGKALHDSSVEKGDSVTPELAAVYSNTFADDMFGVSVSVSQQRRDFRQQYANIQGWQANVGLPDLDEGDYVDPRPIGEDGERIGNHFFPKDMNYGFTDVQNERTNGQVTFQFAPTDTMVFTADYTGSRRTSGRVGFGWGIWNEFGGNINSYILDENGTAVYADIAGNDASFTANWDTTEIEADSVGLNLTWDITPDFRLWVDAHDSSNSIDNGADPGLGSNGQIIMGSDQLQTKIYDYRNGEIPQASVLWNNGTSVLAPNEIGSNFGQFIHSPGESNVKQYQVEGTWYNSVLDIPLVSVKAGISRTDQDMGGYEAWSGLRGGPGFSPSFAEIFPDGMFEYHDTSGFLDEFEGGGSDLAQNYYYTYDYNEALARHVAYLTEDLMGADEFVADAYYDGIDSQSYVREQTDAIFLQSEWEFMIGSFLTELNVGVRYETTDVTSTVRQRVEQQVNWVSASEWIMQYEQGDATFLTQTGEHDVFLPMLDLKVNFTDQLIGRFSTGKTISRAPLGALAGGRSLSASPKPGARTGSSGNPNLLPFESTNLDLAIEYYYGEGSYASVGYFKKDVDNFVQTTITETTVEGLRDIFEGPRYQQAVADVEARGDQATSTAIFEQMIANGYGNADGAIEPNADDPLIVWSISRPSNTDSKSVDGFEIAAQHLFGRSGFGLAANATFVDGDVRFDVTSLEQQAPLTGLSDSANFQAFYEKDGWSVRATYAWRDSYLIGVGQAQGSSDAPPQFAKSYGQWDLSVNYDVTEKLTVFFEGINLNNETEEGYGRYEEQFLFARQYGPRYAVGARYTF
ncbi:TonB-dependent receptor [Idiomarina sp. UBA3162]|uniref:TonB-dependent receptor n=1 Tax=Idiomarina sp. UBA3162 TaxID=1946641 RepID=UPI000C94E7EB|nr:TonB-dependent receptor [Idiomarina sp. UBA3162]MAD54595.1 TonB-dependent receptor [Idiomarinaceae bacterium]